MLMIRQHWPIWIVLEPQCFLCYKSCIGCREASKILQSDTTPTSLLNKAFLEFLYNFDNSVQPEKHSAIGTTARVRFWSDLHHSILSILIKFPILILLIWDDFICWTLTDFNLLKCVRSSKHQVTDLQLVVRLMVSFKNDLAWFTISNFHCQTFQAGPLW